MVKNRSEMKKISQDWEDGHLLDLRSGMNSLVAANVAELANTVLKSRAEVVSMQMEFHLLEEKYKQSQEENRELRMSMEAGEVIIDGLRSQIEQYQVQLAESMGVEDAEIAEVSQLLEGD